MKKYLNGRRIVLFFVFLCVVIYIVFGQEILLKNAKFFNFTPPEIKIGKSTYVVTEEYVSKDQIGSKFARVTKKILAYGPEDNPPEDLGDLYEIKNQNPWEVLALEMNGKLYKVVVVEEN